MDSSTAVMTYRVGEAQITRVTETVLDGFSPAALYADWDAAVLDQYPQLGASLDAHGNALLSIHTWVIRWNGQVILVDTGLGNGKERPFNPMFHRLDTPFLARLAAAGVAPADVDHVLLTHLHSDHVGWNTQRVDDLWVPTFPNATYVLPQGELDFFKTPASASRRVVYEDSVLPVEQAGQALAMGLEGGRYLDGFHFHPTPGHSAGHMSISLVSRGEMALFSGDVMHSPVQVHRPEWNSRFCAEQDRARQSRRWLLEFAATHQAKVFTAHFPQRSAGVVRAMGDGFEWAYLP